MNEADKVKQMLTAIGATAECVRQMFVQLKKQGFTEKQAMELTQTWLYTTFRPQPQPPRREDEDE